MNSPFPNPSLQTAVCQRIAVLGSTGSIGQSTLDVVRHLPDRLQIAGLVAHRSWEKLAEQCREFQPRIAILTDADAFAQADRSQFPRETELIHGVDAVCELCQAADVEVVVSAIVGAAGLRGTWAAIEAKKTIALANKETLVVAGQLVMELAQQRGSTILPVDSEHSAIQQAMHGYKVADVAKVILTASGGPFRGRTRQELSNVTLEQALQHPTWKMGPKITIDSATMMNKALELIEARWLFDFQAEQLDVILHPESIIHSFVEYVDGSVLAQLSPPDMRLPIQYALLYPQRVAGPTRRMNWQELGALHFECPDIETFECLQFGYEVAKQGGTTGAVVNAANEVAVARFLAENIGFLDIAPCVRAVLDSHHYESQPTLSGLLALDQWARQEAGLWTPSRTQTKTRL